MARAALALSPTINIIAPFQDAYCHGDMLRRLVSKGHRRYWTFGKSYTPTTVALPDNRYAKSLDAFPDHISKTGNVDPFYGLLSEYADAGIERPSGYADIFHEKFYSPRVRWSENSAFAECLIGGWQTCASGVHFGTYHKYDITSAYLWSGSLGLPDTTTFQKCRKLETCKGDKNGLFRVRLREVAHQSTLPTPYNAAVECIVTADEINAYNLRIDDVLSGITWDGCTGGDKIVNAVKSVSCWKQVARSYWGRWAQTAKVVCHANGKTWTLGNPMLNSVWSHIVVGRVRERLWRASKNAIHVYVDSVITTDILPTGKEVGDWRLEETYNDGVIIKGPGQYDHRKTTRMSKMAGVPINSPKRNIVPSIQLYQ